MRSLLVLGLLAALTVVAVESLSCQQCSATSSDCSTPLFACTGDNLVSCGASSTSWPADEEPKSYREKFCSGLPAGTSLSFAVRVTGQQQVVFANKFCEEEEGKACEPTPPEDLPADGTGNDQCPTCLAIDPNSCDDIPQMCNDGERCVDLLVEIPVGENTQLMKVKGCSNINDAACIQLSKGNVAVGDITFQHLVCTPEPTTTPASSTISTPSTTSNSSSSSNTTSTPSTTSNSSSSYNTTTFPSTTDSSGLSLAAKLPWIASLVLGLLLL